METTCGGAAPMEMQIWNTTHHCREGAHVVRKAILVIALCLTSLVQAQEQRRLPQEVWNEVYTKRQGRPSHNQFLAERIQGRKPGKALDIGLGEGRNALFLAAQGCEVTGFDISDVGVALAREAAQQRGLKLEAVVENADALRLRQAALGLRCGDVHARCDHAERGNHGRVKARRPPRGRGVPSRPQPAECARRVLRLPE